MEDQHTRPTPTPQPKKEKRGKPQQKKTEPSKRASDEGLGQKVALTLPGYVDKLGSLQMPYDDSLLKAMGVESSNNREQGNSNPDEKTSSQPQQTTSSAQENKNSSTSDRIKKFKAEWGLLRQRCVEPQTTLMVIKTMRVDVLICLKSVKLIPTRSLNLLDLNWDMLGAERISTFVGLFLNPKPDPSYTEGSGPEAYLKGMIDAVSLTQSDLFHTFLESQANISADHQLATESIKEFVQSMKEAENIWRSQSSVCSKYMAEVESQLKLIKIQMDTPKGPPTFPNTEGGSTSTTKSNQFLPYIYVKEGSSISLTFSGSPNNKEGKIIDQVNNILKEVKNPERLTNIHPGIIYQTFIDLFKKYKNPHKALEETIHMLI